MINEIKEALEKATPAPWSDNIFDPYTDVYSYNHQYEEPDELIAKCGKVEDAHLISNAPRYLRYLLHELEKAQKENEALRHRDKIVSLANETLGRYVREGKDEINRLKAVASEQN